MSEFGNQRDEPFRVSRDDGRSADVSKGKTVAKKKSKSFSAGSLLTPLLAIVVLASLGLIWKQSVEISQLRQQTDALNNLLKSTDESLSQSGSALSLKIREQGEALDTHWTEIKKLWGVSNDKNRKAIEENRKLVEQAQTTAKSQQQAIDRVKNSVTGLEKQLKSMSGSIDNLSSNALSLSAQMEELQTKTGAIQSVDKQISALSARVSDAEAGIRAMDSYRSQINQQLQQIRQQLQPAP